MLFKAKKKFGINFAFSSFCGLLQSNGCNTSPPGQHAERWTTDNKPRRKTLIVFRIWITGVFPNCNSDWNNVMGGARRKNATIIIGNQSSAQKLWLSESNRRRPLRNSDLVVLVFPIGFPGISNWISLFFFWNFFWFSSCFLSLRWIPAKSHALHILWQ